MFVQAKVSKLSLLIWLNEIVHINALLRSFFLYRLNHGCPIGQEMEVVGAAYCTEGAGLPIDALHLRRLVVPVGILYHEGQADGKGTRGAAMGVAHLHVFVAALDEAYHHAPFTGVGDMLVQSRTVFHEERVGGKVVEIVKDFFEIWGIHSIGNVC